MASNKDVVFGVFAHESDMQRAVEELKGEDFDSDTVSVVMRDDKKSQIIKRNTEAKGRGTTTGAVVGAVGGVLLGLTAAFVPGGFILAGPAAAVYGLTGAAAGGIAGGLIDMGIPSDRAKFYEDRIKGGDIVVAVPWEDTARVTEIFNNHGALHTEVISAEWTENYTESPWRQTIPA